MALAEMIPESDFTETMKPVHQATHAPGYIYSDPTVYAAEKEKVFLRDWLAVARVEELPNPGDFMTFRIVDEPIIVTRDNNGKINAFANVCKHRGVEVASGDGNTQEACDVEVYASGLRHPYDIVWHSNGRLYNADNDANPGFRDNCGAAANTESAAAGAPFASRPAGLSARPLAFLALGLAALGGGPSSCRRPGAGSPRCR